MKRLIALVLVVLMLGSTAAFAADENMSVEVGDTQVAFDTIQDADGKDTTASQKTDLWLQVEASGQIDVTVPLVLVFKTDIDGGEAATGENYGITNHSTSDIVVTRIASAVTAESDTANPMDLVPTAADVASYADDTYSVKLDVAGVTTTLGKTTDAYTLDLVTIENSETVKDAIEGGWFLLLKAVDGTATFTPVDVTMKTGALSFVTSRTEADEMDATKGLKLMTVTYTVAMDTSAAIGSEITDNDIADAYKYVGTTTTAIAPAQGGGMSGTGSDSDDSEFA